MVFGWFRDRRRRKLLSRPFCDEWKDWLFEDLPMLTRVPAASLPGLIDIARIIVAEKHWSSRGLELTPRIKLNIGTQAALLLLGLSDHDYYRNLTEIIVVARTWEQPMASGALVQQAHVAGAAHHYRGPIELAWDQVTGGANNIQDGHNVVLHEFAHKLDMLDGWADGAPPQKDRAAFDHWNAVMKEHFEQLTEQANTGRRTLLRRYGLTNPAEFFAVATEVFFEKPQRMNRQTPALYQALANYYQQDPATW